MPGLNKLLVLLLSLQLLACGQKDPMEVILSSDDPRIRTVLDNPEGYDVQIRYTRINREEDSVRLTNYDYQVNDRDYFYPASTVKLPTAVLVLEWLNEQPGITRKDSFLIEGDSIRTTFEQEIIELFAVSDNDAYNRLFEVLGKDEINQRLRSKGIEPVRISHRFRGATSYDLDTDPIDIFRSDTVFMHLESKTSQPIQVLNMNRILKGLGYISNDTLVRTPFDCTRRNYYPISAQTEVLNRLYFPELYPESEQFNLSEEQLAFLRSSMSRLPKDAGYNDEDHYDSYVKFFLYGDSKKNIPEHIKIYNKVGLAYGTLTDCAYIVDEKNNVEFMLTATILVNANKIFNDGIYEYDSIGIPFLAGLGQAAYEYELAH